MLNKRIVLVTGGTRGIGLATAKKFLSHGDAVIVCSIDPSEVVETSMTELRALGEVTFLRLDVTKQEECEAVVRKVIEKYGRIDILCNIAGIVGEIKDPMEQDLREVEKVIKVNTMGTIYMAVACGKHMKEQKKGVIINTSSICGFLATNIALGYHASKGAVNMVTKVLAKDWGQYGIRVVAVSPGTVRTRLMDDYKDDPNFEKTAASYHMKNRVIEPEEIAGAFYLLSLDDAAAVNGSVVMTEDGFCSFIGIF